MNQKTKALGGFNQKGDDELLVRANTIWQAMINNIHFTDPSPSMNELVLLVQEFRDKLVICRRRGSPHDTAAKNAARKALTGGLNQLAAYVTRIADGNLPALLSSGFETNRYRRSVDLPGTVSGVVLTDGKQSGQMRLDFVKQRQVLMYEYRFAPEADGQPGEWSGSFITTSSRNNVLAPLEPLLRYYVQVRAVNGIGKTEWSDIVSFVPR